MGYIYAAVGVLIVVLGLACTALYYRSEAAVAAKDAAIKELTVAVEVNQRNAETMRRLQATQAAERKATEKELEAVKLRAASLEKIAREMDNVEGANDPAGAFWDAYGEQLRAARGH